MDNIQNYKIIYTSWNNPYKYLKLSRQYFFLSKYVVVPVMENDDKKYRTVNFRDEKTLNKVDHTLLFKVDLNFFNLFKILVFVDCMFL